MSQLGSAVPIPPSPEAAMLETVPNPHPDATYLVRFACP
ncbi:MAG TPA: NADPH-dependent 7-cyano-7-deazaguanine reductase QueF, partial [Rhodospirillales bacterium]|nr:NADPH-dependent 7-cyano-7-deazaguanine reductase QueF [Rhodospirillales bacterium]